MHRLPLAILIPLLALTSRADASEPAEPAPKPVLFVVTSATQQELANGKVRNTGVFLGELYDAWKTLETHGHPVGFATPDGQPPALDPESLDDKYWKGRLDEREAAQAFFASDPGLNQPLAVENAAADLDQWSGIVVPGGQGVMVDLLFDEPTQRLVRDLGARGRPVGLICHAPALLAELDLPEDHALYGRRVSSVTGFEEFYIERFVMGGKALDRKIKRRLRDAGFVYDGAGPGASHAVRDGHLVTSQNPFSGEPFGELFLEALDEAHAAVPVARRDPRDRPARDGRP